MSDRRKVTEIKAEIKEYKQKLADHKAAKLFPFPAIGQELKDTLHLSYLEGYLQAVRDERETRRKLW